MPYVPLVDITIRLISGWFAVAAVRGTAMVVDTGILRYHGWKNAFIYVSRREIGTPEVARLIRIVEFKIQRLCESVICPTA